MGGVIDNYEFENLEMKYRYADLISPAAKKYRYADLISPTAKKYRYADYYD